MQALKSVVALSFLAASSASAAEIKCVSKVLALLDPGARWADGPTHYPAHVEFFAKQAAAGAIHSGGPIGPEGQPMGGLIIYNLTDVAAVEKISQEDPFVKEGVVTLTVAPWQMCSLQ